MESRQQMIEQENFLSSADKPNVQEAIERIKSNDGECDLSYLNLTSEDLKFLLSADELKDDILRLTLLVIRNNKIAILPPEIDILQNLEDLDISGNQIQELPQGISLLQKLKKFDARGNPLTRETRDFLTDNPHLHAIYNMAAFDDIKDWEGVLSNTSFNNDSDIIKIIKDSEGLQKFLSRSGIDNKERKDALDYLLKKINNPSTREKTTISMIAATGDCSTPIHDYLANAYFEMCTEYGIAIDENITAKMAINNYLEKNINKGKIKLTPNEEIEQKHALLNALLLHKSEHNKLNKFKIDDKPYRIRSSDTRNIDFSYHMLQQEAINQCAKLFCKTDQNGNLIKQNGHYIADKVKYDNVIENFKVNSLGKKGEEVMMYNNLILILSKENDDQGQNHRETEPSYYGLNGTKAESIIVIRDALRAIRFQNPQTQEISPENLLDFLYSKYSNVSSQKGQQGIEEELKFSHDHPMQEKGNRIVQQIETVNLQAQKHNKNTNNPRELGSLERNIIGKSSGGKRQRGDNDYANQMQQYSNNQYQPEAIGINQQTSQQFAARLYPIDHQNQMHQQYMTYNQNHQQYSVNQYNEQASVNQQASQQMSQSSNIFSQRELQQRRQEEFYEKFGDPNSAASRLGYGNSL